MISRNQFTSIPLAYCCIALISMLFCMQANAYVKHNKTTVMSMVKAEAIRQDMPIELALAVARVESNFNPDALSSAGAKGVMQIMPRTAEKVLGISQYRLYNPEVNIEAGIRFLKSLLKRYDNRWEIALSHYNGGSKVNNFGQLRVIPATQKYVNDVLAWSKKYRQRGDRWLDGGHRDFYKQNKSILARGKPISLDDFGPEGIFADWRSAKHQRKVQRQSNRNARIFAIESERQTIVEELQKLANRNLNRVDKYTKKKIQNSNW